MTQLNEEHFELHDQNKAERYERQKIKFLEDRITTLEKSIERLNKIVSIWKFFIKAWSRGEQS
jgi:cob(I)alamin adenosyltransferase